MLAHLRPTLRMMLRRPWSAAAIAGTLALGVGAAGLSASALPARRAAAFDPAATLREE